MLSVASLTATLGAFTLRDVSFDLARGAYGIVIGPAGAGKTTLLEAIAGVIPLRSGTVVIGGADVTSAPPDRRRSSIVYQHGYLFPHLTVGQNIAYGAATAADAVEESERFGLGRLAHRDVRTLSGGERQLVALARALARRPELLLLDEPFAALDQRTRNVARRSLRTIYEERGFTVLHVTHDFAEAGMLGDLAILLDGGRVLQTDTPDALFRKPISSYVADFLGADNVLAGVATPIAEAGSKGGVVDAEAIDQVAVAFTTGALTVYAVGGADLRSGPAHAVIRSEEIAVSLETGTSSIRNQFSGVVVELVPAGAVTRVTVDVQGTLLIAAVTSRSARDLELVRGKRVVVGFKAMAVHLC